ncbi:MAG: pilin [Patescibacteria group bacterium]|jgi:hypothetical protein|nr:pilin [Patescibacteria group bacterium]MDD3777989.1 pilin [Patescibacteria group bacterium]MDD3939203.1 pilin [Patescibacteria group bacterium]MDD4443493.1 pilin [Patescibacteria group bacterium]NCU39591.1 hypothetical protein [Candidatus Falkowbacteria bacterium]
MTINKKSILSFFFLLLFIIPVSFTTYQVNIVSADQSLVDGQVGLKEVGSVFGGNRAEQDPRYMIANFISIALGFIGIIFLGLTIFAGFQYMTAGGNSEKTSKALGLLKNAIIGLVIILMAWAITRFTIVMLNRAAKNADTSIYPSVGL